MKNYDITELAKQHKEKEQDKRKEELTKIGDDIYSQIKENNISVAETERIIAYMNLKCQNEVQLLKENKMSTELKSNYDNIKK